MRDCMSINILMDFVSQRLSPMEREYVFQHIEECETCADVLNGLEIINASSSMLLSKNIELSQERVSEILKKRFPGFGAKEKEGGLDETEKLYTLEELLSMFKRVDYYDAHILECECRSIGAIDHKELKIKLPEEDEDGSVELIFELNQPAPDGLLLEIENNELDTVFSDNFPLQEERLNLSHITKNLKPGCYYWRITKEHTDSDTMLLGRFFIRKDLKPEQ